MGKGAGEKAWEHASIGQRARGKKIEVKVEVEDLTMQPATCTLQQIINILNH